jgi:hypothetical protein
LPVTSSVHASKTNEVSNFAKDLLLIGVWLDETRGIARQLPFPLRFGLMEQKGIENPFSLLVLGLMKGEFFAFWHEKHAW